MSSLFQNHSYYSLPFLILLLALLYTSLLSLYLDWKPGPRYKGDSTLQLWCRAWSMWLSSGLLFQKDSFFEQYCSSIPVNSSIINLVLEVHCDLYIYRTDYWDGITHSDYHSIVIVIDLDWHMMTIVLLFYFRPSTRTIYCYYTICTSQSCTLQGDL